MTLTLSAAFAAGIAKADVAVNTVAKITANDYPCTCVWTMNAPDQTAQVTDGTLFKDSMGRHDLVVHDTGGVPTIVTHQDAGLRAQLRQYVTMGTDSGELYADDHADFRPGDADFTFACWLYIDSFNDDNGYAWCKVPSSGTAATRLYIKLNATTHTLTASFGGVDVTTADAFPSKTWCFVWMRRSGAVGQLGWTTHSAGTFDVSPRASSSSVVSTTVGADSTPFDVGGNSSGGIEEWAFDQVYWVNGDFLTDAELTFYYNGGDGTEGHPEKTYLFSDAATGWLDAARTVYAPPLLSRVTPVPASVDPATYDAQVGEVTVELIDEGQGGAVRRLIAANRLHGKLLTIMFGPDSADYADYAPYFCGIITRIQPADGRISITAESAMRKLADTTKLGLWWGLHPAEVIGDCVRMATLPKELVDADSLDYDEISDGTHAEWDDCLCWVVRHGGHNLNFYGGDAAKPSKLLDVITAMCRLVRASLVPDETGALTLRRHSSAAAVVDTWTADDFANSEQVETDGLVRNSIAATWGNYTPSGLWWQADHYNHFRGNWRISGATSANTDAMRLYYEGDHNGSTYTVNVYKDSGGGAGDKVATGTFDESAADSGTVTLAESNSSGITGSVDIAGYYYPGDSNVYYYDLPCVQGQVIDLERGFEGGWPTRALRLRTDTAVAYTATPGESEGDVGISEPIEFVDAVGRLGSNISSVSTSASVEGNPSDGFQLQGFSGTGDLATSPQPAVRQVSATSPAYLLVEGEIIKATSSTVTEVGAEIYMSNDDSRRAVHPITEIGYQFTNAGRGQFGTPTRNHTAGAHVYDVTLIVGMLSAVLTRFALGVTVVQLETDLSKYAVQIGDLVALEYAHYIAYGSDGLAAGNSLKWEVCGKETDLSATPPRIKWRLVRT
jgi:hypothetical protein